MFCKYKLNSSLFSSYSKFYSNRILEMIFCCSPKMVNKFIPYRYIVIRVVFFFVRANHQINVTIK